ncbi:MAG: tRNA pseudouridine(55) synthase TruB [Acholeplasmataceae bacterium]|nr:tRNA pseudouridine(55) synthase TruB [Acholeplasmataceae bacterium]
MDGFLLINKTQGMTSHDVVSSVKKKFHIEKIGHTGTLDPFACGLLILVFGKATKLAHLFQEQNKTYEGVIAFGNHYDTYDITGTILKTKTPLLNINTLQKAAESMIGTYHQEPPMYSAIKKDGRKLYELARQGKEVERKTRPVHIFDFRIINQLDHQRYRFYTSVSKGTYIRSLAVDVARKLDEVAALESLNRVSIGKYHIEQSKKIEETTKDDIILLTDYFSDYPKLMVNDYLLKLVQNGVYLDERQIKTELPFVVCDEKGGMVAYYEPISTFKYKPILIF